MIYYQFGSETTVMGPGDLEYGVFSALVRLGSRKKVLAVPPDFTRFHSRAEIEPVNFKYFDLKIMIIIYDPAKLCEGVNKLPDGEEIYYILRWDCGLQKIYLNDKLGNNRLRNSN